MNFVWKNIKVRCSTAKGWIPEWPKGTDCKSVGIAFGGSNPPPPTILYLCLKKTKTMPLTRTKTGKQLRGLSGTENKILLFAFLSLVLKF